MIDFIIKQRQILLCVLITSIIMKSVFLWTVRSGPRTRAPEGPCVQALLEEVLSFFLSPAFLLVVSGSDLPESSPLDIIVFSDGGYLSDVSLQRAARPFVTTDGLAWKQTIINRHAPHFASIKHRKCVLTRSTISHSENLGGTAGLSPQTHTHRL